MVQLRDFQSTLVDRLGSPDLLGRLVGDEMGLGKTYEALAIEARLRLANPARRNVKRRTLIIAPWSVHDMWRSKIREFMGPLTTIAVVDRKNRTPFVNAVLDGQHDYYIVHYEALRLRGMEVLKSVSWFHVIADEIQRIKNPKAAQTRAFRKLKARYKTGLSGSMADDKPQDMWMPLHWAQPGLFPSGGVKNPLKRFRDDWCLTEEVEGRWIGTNSQGDPIHETYQQIVGLDPTKKDRFHATIAPFFMRRLKKDVLDDLPDKYSTVINVTLSPKQMRIYEQLRKEFQTWIGENEDQPLQLKRGQWFSRLTRLQQAALAYLTWEDTGKIDPATKQPIKKVKLIEPSAKLDQLVDFMKDVTTRVVIFSNSRGMIGLVEDRLSKEGLLVGTYMGMMNEQVRVGNLRDFQAGKLDVFASTIKAGGEGIDLTTASTVMFLDRTWSPFRNLQAEDRCHRIGQKNAVEVVDFYANRTVDAKVRDVNIDKWAKLKELLGDE